MANSTETGQFEGSVTPCTHFVAFRTDSEYWNAVRIWGKPHFIHRRWDTRARRELAPNDLVIFARGEWTDEPHTTNGNDIEEKYLR